MGDTTTPNLGLTKPEFNASDDTWGTKSNTNWDLLDAKFPARNVAILTNPSLSGTNSTSYVHLGMGSTLALTPAASGKIKIVVFGYCSSAGAAADLTVALAYGTGSAPANGAAATGTTLVGELGIFIPASNKGVPFSFDYELDGLTTDTAYWFDIIFKTDFGAAQGDVFVSQARAEEIRL